MRRWIAIVLLLIVGGIARADAIGSGDVSVNFLPGQGMTIDFCKVPLSRGSTLQLFAPGWTKGYFSSIGTRPEVQTDPAKRQIDVIYHADKDVQFDATESIRFVNDHRIEITLNGTLGTNVPAKLEWAIGHINAFALYGGGFIGGDVGQMIPVSRSLPAASADAAVVENANRVTIISPVGRAVVKMEEGGGKLSLLDGRVRSSGEWAQEQPTFWLGCLGEDVAVEKSFHYLVSIEFEPAEKPTTVPSRQVQVKSEAVGDAIIPQSIANPIIPQPKKLTWGDGTFALGPKVKLQSSVKEAQAGIEAIKKEMRERFQWDWSAAEESSPVISFQEDKSLPTEGYRIECTPVSLQVTAGDPRGFFNAAQTFAQLVTVRPEGVLVPSCTIEDWPSLAFRGVHIFPGKGAMDLHRKLIERIFARYKFNYLVLECEFAQWETDPKIWTDMSISKDELRQYVQAVRENQLEPIPLVESLGHVTWMFKNGQNLDLAEDPNAGWAYDATNPKTYEFIEKVYDEAIDIFHPKYFHIGHDEVPDRGRYPYRESSKKIGMAKLFTSDVQKLTDYLAAKNIKPMLWGDMLLAKDESNDGATHAPSNAVAEQMRSEIPKEAAICDWHYTPTKPEGYRSLKIFEDAGFKQTIACPWFNPQNIYTFSTAAHEDHCWGLLQTTWAGYSIDEGAIQRELKQFSAYILAAEYAWNAGEAPPPEKLPYRPEDVFARAMYPQPEIVGTRPGQLVDLSASPAEDQRDDGIRFKVAKPAIALGGELNGTRELPRSVTLLIGQAAQQIAVLQATTYRAKPGEQVGAYEIHFADGSAVSVPLLYGSNIRALDDANPTMNASLAWPANSSGDQKDNVRLFLWQNPHRQREIRSITLTTDHPYASPMLLGMTLLN